jgi:hypothetical protein
MGKNQYPGSGINIIFTILWDKIVFVDLAAATGRGVEHSWLEPGHQVTRLIFYPVISGTYSKIYGKFWFFVNIVWRKN